MATKKAPARSAAPAGTARAAVKHKGPAPKGNQVFLFDRSNYLWMIAGFVLIMIGFFLMTGGKSPDPHKFNYDEIYSFRRVTLSPIIIVIGFVLEVYAIMKKPAQQPEQE